MLVEWLRYDPVLFDLDGAIRPSARIPERAWAEPFAARDCTPDDHLTGREGKARLDGLRTIPSVHGVELPGGDPAVTPDGGVPGAER